MPQRLIVGVIANAACARAAVRPAGLSGTSHPPGPLLNANLRQLLHVGFKVAAKMGPRYLKLLEECETSVARNVTGNLFDRHLKPLFLAK